MATAIIPGFWDEGCPAVQLPVPTEEAYDMARRLALEEGMLVGQSAGAAVCATLELARQISKGVILTILPDAGDRYFSTRLWEGSAVVGGNWHYTFHAWREKHPNAAAD